MVRRANRSDLDRILEVYALARAYMKSVGNGGQWKGEYPEKELLEDDLDNGNLYVVERNSNIVAAFYFAVIDDPTYRVIDGAWHYSGDYGVIHRLGSSGHEGGIFGEVLSYCLSEIGHIRVDTHEKNLPMRRKLDEFGFGYTGTIICHDGTERMAYDIKF